MGFWDYTINGISTPSATWMGELLKAQQDGRDLPPDESSLRAGQLPNPPHSTSEFLGHAALIDGDWKLHRIEGKNGKVAWELYDLKNDSAETNDLLAQQDTVAAKLKPKLEAWLSSVARSLNGEDYVVEKK